MFKNKEWQTLSRQISLRAEEGTPSSSSSSLTLLRATISWVSLFLALNTVPYVPSQEETRMIKTRFMDCDVVWILMICCEICFLRITYLIYCRNHSHLLWIITPLYHPVYSLFYLSMVGASLVSAFSWLVDIAHHNQYGTLKLWGLILL